MKSKRATTDEPIYLDAKFFEELRALILKIKWPYKSQLADKLTLRDRALVAFLILTGLRISEAIQVKRKQIREYENRVEVLNLKTLKHNNLRARVMFPKIGAFKPFTFIFLDWLKEVQDPEAFLFPRWTPAGFKYDKAINRHRAYQTVALTGKFPHWFRAVCETVYGKKIFKNDAWKLKQFMGLRTLEATSYYVQGSWEENEKDVFKL